jgi:photosystem II stability/assembly factor-like uncharacterized protein
MLPPIPPSPEETRRALAQVGVLRAEARRRRRRRRFAVGGMTAAVVAAATGVSAWLVPSQRSSTVKVISPSPTVPFTAPTTAPPSASTTLPAVATTPLPTLIYRGPGVTLVGVSPLCCGYEGAKPSRLYLSTDLVHWTDITPPQSQRINDPRYPAYGFFEQASFLSPSVGWITTWNPATIQTTIYRTNSGGRTWTSVPGGGHGAHGGAAALIDLLSPTTAFEEQLEPTAPATSLSVTTDSGQSWKTVYRAPQQPNVPQGPLDIRMVFTDPQHGFAADGVPPAGSFGPGGDMFYTSDGGSSWQKRTLPLPVTTLACPTSANASASTSCSYSVPVFSNPRDGAVAAVVASNTQAQVAFDVTSDGGQSWRRTSQLTVTVSANHPRFACPLISVVPTGSWWVLCWTGSSASTQVTTDQGTNWTTNRASLPPGVPTSLEAFDSNQALLSVENTTPDATITQLLVTHDAGRHWTPLSLPG